MISFVKKMWQKYAVGDLATKKSESFASSDSNLSDAPENEKSEHIKKYIATLLTIYEDKDPIRTEFGGRETKINEAKTALKAALGLDNNKEIDEPLQKLEEKVKRKMSFLPSISIFRKGRDKELKPSDNEMVKLLQATSFKIDRRVFAPQPKYKTLDSIKERVEDNKNRIHLKTKNKSGRTK